MMIVINSHYDFITELAIFLKWLSFKVDILMKNEYYILFMIISLIFMIQIGVPLILGYIVEEKNDER